MPGMATSLLPPLKFNPIIKPLPWGGRKLEQLFNKLLPTGVPCGESWEVVDLPGDQSVVAEEKLAATNLGALVQSRRDELLGEAELLMGRFPVLFKFIDAKETLSVQVHPDEEACQIIGLSARPKTEAWYILQADPGARLYLGLQEGVGPEDLGKGIEDGKVAEMLQPVTVQPGDFIYLPSGTLHAIGGGIVLAEIQQSSDTTYRVFDWNRVGLDGLPRPLHIGEALTSIHFDMRGRPPHATPFSGRPGIRCKYFSFERINLQAGQETPLEAGRPRILCCIEGQGFISETGAPAVSLRVGETCLVPACRAESLASEGGGVFLLIRV
jgi:mannose-6-phosphate isomerase